MSKTIKIILGVVILVIIVILVTVIYKPIPKETIKIGVIAPLSGNLTFVGEGYRDAFLLAKENSKNTKYNYELIFEDDQMDPAKTATALQKLISIDKVNAVVSFASGPANVISPIAEQNKIIHFGIATDPSSAKGEYNFMHWTPPSEEAKTFVAELQKRGIKKLGIFVTNQQGVLATVAAITEQLKSTNIEIVTEQKFNMDERDFRTLIAKAKSSGAEIYLLETFPPQLELLIKQIKEAGISIPLTCIELVESSDEAMKLFEGYWYVNSADSTTEFNKKFEDKYGKTPPPAAANGYDIFNMLVAAYEKAGKYEQPTPEKVIGALNQIKNFDGALGKLNMGPDGIVFSPAVVRMIKDGKPVTVSD